MGENGVAKALMGIGVAILIIGFVGGIVLAMVLGNSKFDDYAWVALVYTWAGCFIQGMLFIGFSEAIQKLSDSVVQRGIIIQQLRGDVSQGKKSVSDELPEI